VLPVDYTVEDSEIVLQVGDRLFARVVDQLGAFQVDYPSHGAEPGDGGPDGRWSVLLRGVLEDDPDPAVDPVLAAGLYESAPVVGECPLPVPPWLPIPVASVVAPERRILDLCDDLLTREVGEPDALLRTARFLRIDRPGANVLVADVDPSLVAGDLIAQPSAPTGVRPTSPPGGGVALATSTSCRPSLPGQDGPVAIERLAAYASSAGARPPLPPLSGCSGDPNGSVRPVCSPASG